MNDNTDEIDLIELLKTIWRGKETIIVVSFVFAVIGVGAALLSPVIYSSSTTFITSNSESTSSSGLSGVASLVGINLGGMSSGNEIPASMYPQIGESIDFKRALLKSFVDDNEQIKLDDFLITLHGIEKTLNTQNKSLNIAKSSLTPKELSSSKFKINFLVLMTLI